MRATKQQARRGGQRGFANPLIDLCVYRGGKLAGIARIPASLASEYKRKNPGATGCRPERPTITPGRPALTQLLDASNNGTFADARRAAILGHQPVDQLTGAIGGLMRAAENGVIDDDLAARRIAALASPALAAAQAQLQRPQLTAEQAAELRRRRAAGLSDSGQTEAQLKKLQEACNPRVCWITKDVRTGKPNGISTGNIDPAIVVKAADFVRFCTPEDLRNAATAPTAWGSWALDRVAQLAELPGAVLRPERRRAPAHADREAPAPDAPVAPAPPPAPAAPELLCWYTKDVRTGVINARNTGYALRSVIMAAADFAGWC